MPACPHLAELLAAVQHPASPDAELVVLSRIAASWVRTHKVDSHSSTKYCVPSPPVTSSY